MKKDATAIRVTATAINPTTKPTSPSVGPPLAAESSSEAVADGDGVVEVEGVWVVVAVGEAPAERTLDAEVNEVRVTAGGTGNADGSGSSPASGERLAVPLSGGLGGGRAESAATGTIAGGSGTCDGVGDREDMFLPKPV